MKFCPQCKTTYDDNVNVCTQCGAPLMAFQPVASANPTDHTAEFDPADISQNKIFAMTAYLLGFVGVIIALLAAGASPYTAFHVRQALKIQIVAVISLVFMIFPIVGWLVVGVWAIITVVIEIICFFRVCSGRAIEAPIISSFGFLK